MVKDAIVNALLAKYGMPEWVRPYVVRYIRNCTVSEITRARGFVDFGRKKGVQTDDGMVLPNGVRFSNKQICHLLCLFYYAENRISEVSNAWATTSMDRDPQHRRHFADVSEIEAAHARAIKNLVSFVGCRELEDPPQELVDVFDYLAALTDWNERIVAKRLLLNYGYARTFGYVFYKVFYPVSPEFMRSLRAAFRKVPHVQLVGSNQVEAIIRTGLISHRRMLDITENMLSLIARSVDVEMPNAKKAGIEKEVALLRDISIAYPLHILEQYGIRMDIDNEVAKIRRMSLSRHGGVQ